jgi:alkylhydroperoxidase family enzyme
MADTVLVPPHHIVPVAFTRAQLDWLPWLEPLTVEALTERHLASFVDAVRVKSPYFRLLARDPDALEARTRTDKDIFLAISDVIHAAAFFNWANRLMLSLGEPAVAAGC